MLLNSAFALVAGGKSDSVEDGIKLAARTIDSGAAAEKLEKLVEISNG